MSIIKNQLLKHLSRYVFVKRPFPKTKSFVNSLSLVRVKVFKRTVPKFFNFLRYKIVKFMWHLDNAECAIYIKNFVLSL